jgi:hypothetical protein
MFIELRPLLYPPMPGRPANPSSSRPRGTKSVLADADFAGLVQRARELEALDLAVRGTLPAALASQSRLANIRGSRLVYVTASSAAAARLRTLAPELLAAASRHAGRRFDAVSIKVARLDAVPPAQPRRKPLSRAAAAQLDGAASAIADPELQAVLRRLASLA